MPRQRGTALSLLKTTIKTKIIIYLIILWTGNKTIISNGFSQADTTAKNCKNIKFAYQDTATSILGTDCLLHPFFRSVVNQNFPPPRFQIITYEICTSLAITNYFSNAPPQPLLDQVSSSILRHWVVKKQDTSSQQCSERIWRSRQTWGGLGACSPRKFFNLGSPKCHLLHFLQNIFS